MFHKCIIVVLSIAGLTLANTSNKKVTKTTTEPSVTIAENVSPRTRPAPQRIYAAAPEREYIVPLNTYTSTNENPAFGNAYPGPIGYSAAQSAYPFHVNAPGYANVLFPAFPTGSVAYATSARPAYRSASGVQFVAVPNVPYATAAPGAAYSTTAPLSSYSTPSPIAVYSTQSPVAVYSTAAPSFSSPVPFAYSTPAPPTYVVSPTIAPPNAGTHSSGPIITTYSASPVLLQPSAQATNPTTQSLNSILVARRLAYSIAPRVVGADISTPLINIFTPTPGDGRGNAVSYQSSRQVINSPNIHAVTVKPPLPYSATPLVYPATAGASGLVNRYQIIAVPVGYTGAPISQAPFPRVGGAYRLTPVGGVPVGNTLSAVANSAKPSTYGPYQALALAQTGRSLGAHTAATTVADRRYRGQYSSRYSFNLPNIDIDYVYNTN